MPVEVARIAEELNPLWPRGTDPVSKADDHLRMIKEVLQLEFDLLYNKTRLFSFEAGAVVTPDVILYYEAEKAFYAWNGAYDENNEYIVSAGSTPATSGGVAGNAWTRSTGAGLMSAILVSDVAPITPFENMLWWDTTTGIFFIYYNDGTSTQWVDLFGMNPNWVDAAVLSRVALKRLAAEAGYNLVEGSFEQGALLINPNDVLWYQGDGRYYKWHLNEVKSVLPGSIPSNIGTEWLDKTGDSLRKDINIVWRHFDKIADVDGNVSLGEKIVVESYYGDYDSPSMFFKVVAAGTGTHDGGKYIDLPTSGLQLEQNLKLPVNVKVYGAKGDGSTNDAPYANSALAYGKATYFPGSVYIIESGLLPTYNQIVFGDGDGCTIIRAVGDANISAFNVSDLSRVNLKDLTLDGNKLNRPLSPGGNGVLLRGTFNRCIGVGFINWPNAGALCDGQIYESANNLFDFCRFEDNDGVGLSQHTSKYNTIINSYFRGNGLENITIDNTSHGCFVTNNRFYKHLGGCGCIGWDQADFVRVIDNYLDGENSTDTAVGARTGICWNAVAGPNNNGIIQNNTIVNYLEYGFDSKDRTGTGGYLGGTGIIESNTITNCGAPARFANLFGTLIYRNNRTTSSVVLNDTTGNLQADPGFTYSRTRASSAMSYTANAAWVERPTATTITNILMTNNAGAILVPLTGKYQITAKIDTSGLSGSDVTIIQVGFGVKGAGVPLVYSATTVVSAVNTCEGILSTVLPLTRGEHIMYVRAFSTSGTTVVSARTGADSELALTYLGA